MCATCHPCHAILTHPERGTAYADRADAWCMRCRCWADRSRATGVGRGLQEMVPWATGRGHRATRSYERGSWHHYERSKDATNRATEVRKPWVTGSLEEYEDDSAELLVHARSERGGRGRASVRDGDPKDSHFVAKSALAEHKRST